eukprot:1158686-Pelagomonas_calceolata.AAC.4
MHTSLSPRSLQPQIICVASLPCIKHLSIAIGAKKHLCHIVRTTHETSGLLSVLSSIYGTEQHLCLIVGAKKRGASPALRGVQQAEQERSVLQEQLTYLKVQLQFALEVS